jgi:hypothetical protein
VPKTVEIVATVSNGLERKVMNEKLITSPVVK